MIHELIITIWITKTGIRFIYWEKIQSIDTDDLAFYSSIDSLKIRIPYRYN